MSLTLSILPESFAVCHLDAVAPLPAWPGGSFVSMTRTADELSIVCRQADVPSGVKHEPGWRCLKVEGPLDFALVGILASLATPLAQAGISIFAISTFDTDYLLIKESDQQRAIDALRGAGHAIVARPDA